ncbi:MAG TPA: hypothetical protein VF974_00040 [Patescibacteria group bacterium]
MSTLKSLPVTPTQKWTWTAWDLVFGLILIAVCASAGLGVYAEPGRGNRSLVQGWAIVKTDLRIEHPQQLIYSADGAHLSPVTACKLAKDTSVELMGSVGPVTIGHVMTKSQGGCSPGLLVQLSTSELRGPQYGPGF